ncbi:MFS transporter [Hominibacterium faecale]|uniref:MFS transporter n=1 Tax=Hominibacterium faecale TaxID=2839743 RepID=UPI0022B2A090|nr:MFS transporter [Hominibacterium faecale]
MKTKGNVLGLTGEISIGKKIRYSLGNAGDELPYALFYTYFMMYLTEVAGINAVVAGIISAVAAACDGLVDPALGIFSDNLYRKHGTRRTGMIIGLGPLAIVTILLFVPAPFSGVGELIYYCIFSILFVTCFSMYSTNFISMGAEMTDSYEERNFLRLLCGLTAPLFSYLGHGGPQLAKAILPEMDVDAQWLTTGISVTLVYGICCLVCIFAALSPRKVKALRAAGRPPKEAAAEENDDVKIGKLNFIENVTSLLKIKALKVQLIMVFAFTVANGFFYALIAYVLTYSMELNAAQQATFWAVESVVYYGAIVLCVPVANKFGKKPMFIVCYAVAGVTMTSFFFLNLNSLGAAVAMMVAFTLVEAPFWTLHCTMGYEISDIDEFANGKRRTSLVISFASLFVKIGPTLSYIFTGIILSSIGYVEGGVSQPESVAEGLHGYITLLPGIFLLLGVIAALQYPVTRKGFDALTKALEAKRAGEDYSTEGFEHMLPKAK